MDAKTDLLTTLLKCGYLDIDALISVLDMGNELFDDNILAELIDEYGSEVFDDFNNLMYHLMDSIVLRLVAELDGNIENDKDRYIYILDEHWEYPYVNYLDSSFQLESLDGWKSGDGKDKLLEDLKKELISKKFKV